ncbi:hypothetical protein E2986_13970 [Frieseomelitta varia]|uniref:Uncharacterized protein n=1 Tax=Frieseomelitta varia TaxID=561572 RepID=A0A833RRN8_9HYME|nr:hypothetical protein E2986_13970 [Frieseomelitta varia]
MRLLYFTESSFGLNDSNVDARQIQRDASDCSEVHCGCGIGFKNAARHGRMSGWMKVRRSSNSSSSSSSSSSVNACLLRQPDGKYTTVRNDVLKTDKLQSVTHYHDYYMNTILFGGKSNTFVKYVFNYYYTHAIKEFRNNNNYSPELFEIINLHWILFLSERLEEANLQKNSICKRLQQSEYLVSEYLGRVSQKSKAAELQQISTDKMKKYMIPFKKR